MTLFSSLETWLSNTQNFIQGIIILVQNSRNTRILNNFAQVTLHTYNVKCIIVIQKPYFQDKDETKAKQKISYQNLLLNFTKFQL